MYQTLVPCPGCRRHVRARDGACPFCAATLENATAVPSAPQRLARGAVVVFASSVAMIAGCSSDESKPVTSTDAGTVTDTGGPVAAYGAPADTGAITDGGADDGTVDDTGAPGTKYGGPPVPDASGD